MKRIQIKIRKSKKSEYLEGEYFVKALDFDEVQAYFQKSQANKDEDARFRLVQMCLVNKDGSNVFLPKQINIIKDRLIGTHLLNAMVVATKENDFTSFTEDYEKNLESDQD